jgi:D-glycero-alpha-D-manno-heptose 1-phosphate guanylyltransferase
MKAIVLAGGYGTRLGSLTQHTPKPLIPISERPFIEYVFDHLFLHEIDEIILSVGYLAEQFIRHFGSAWKGIPIRYSIEQEALGTGGAIKYAFESFKLENAIVVNGDTLALVNLSDLTGFAVSLGAALIMATKKVEDTGRYGRIALDENCRILSFDEKCSGEPGFINLGVYYLSREIFAASPNGQFSFEHDTLSTQVANIAMFAFKTDNYFIDIGVPEDLNRAALELAAISCRA